MTEWSNRECIPSCNGRDRLPRMLILLIVGIVWNSRTASNHVIPQPEGCGRAIDHLLSPGLDDLNRAIQRILVKLFLEHPATVVQSGTDFIECGRTLFPINIQRRGQNRELLAQQSPQKKISVFGDRECSVKTSL